MIRRRVKIQRTEREERETRGEEDVGWIRLCTDSLAAMGLVSAYRTAEAFLPGLGGTKDGASQSGTRIWLLTDIPHLWLHSHDGVEREKGSSSLTVCSPAPHLLWHVKALDTSHYM